MNTLCDYTDDNFLFEETPLIEDEDTRAETPLTEANNRRRAYALGKKTAKKKRGDHDFDRGPCGMLKNLRAGDRIPWVMGLFRGLEEKPGALGLFLEKWIAHEITDIMKEEREMVALMTAALETPDGAKLAKFHPTPGQAPSSCCGQPALREFFAWAEEQGWRFMMEGSNSPRQQVQVLSVPPGSSLNPSQVRAARRLVDFMQLQQAGVTGYGGVKLRTQALVVGPSGSGKTHVVFDAAKTLGVAVYAINVQNWIVRGARYGQSITLDLVKTFVTDHDAGIIFLDEINKLSVQHTNENAWSADLFSEAMALLDGDEKLQGMGFSEELMKKLQSSFLIVSAGAFQDLWRQTENHTVTFTDIELGRSDYATSIRNQQLVPEELLNRFNEELLVIDPPSSEDFAKAIGRIRKSAGLPELPIREMNALTEEAVRSEKNMRWLEAYTTRMAIHELPRRHPVKAIELTEEPKVKSSQDINKAYQYLTRHADEFADACHRLAVEIRALRCTPKPKGFSSQVIDFRGPQDAQKAEDHLLLQADWSRHFIKPKALAGRDITDDLKNLLFKDPHTVKLWELLKQMDDALHQPGVRQALSDASAARHRMICEIDNIMSLEGGAPCWDFRPWLGPNASA